MGRRRARVLFFQDIRKDNLLETDLENNCFVVVQSFTLEQSYMMHDLVIISLINRSFQQVTMALNCHFSPLESP